MARAFRLLSILCVLSLSVIPGCSKTSGGSAVSFRSQDGVLLEGRTFGRLGRGVILAHMYPGDQSRWFGFAKDLSNLGFQVLTFNFRGYGHSQGTKDVPLISRDVVGAVEFMHRSGVKKIVLIGASMGGTASLVAASQIQVQGVATLSAPERFMGLDAEPALTSVSAEKIFLAAQGDPNSKDATSMLKGTNDPGADIRLFPGADHGIDMLSGRSGEEVRKVLIDFIRKSTS
ncbi:MAG: alpha/beta hydrolase family protein [Actinomycetota bacterium]|nr:alpha/beta hydrolase [Actinomycetota bacterium]